MLSLLTQNKLEITGILPRLTVVLFRDYFETTDYPLHWLPVAFGFQFIFNL